MIPQETSADYGPLVHRAQEARAESQRQVERATRLGDEARLDQGHMLTELTTRLDWRCDVPPGSAQRLARLSAAVGRDASIEQAKLMLRDRYQITGNQAFDLLRHISQSSNRKVRDVARDMLAG
jgi:AmiR/NasT family two-component response regulator